MQENKKLCTQFEYTNRYSRINSRRPLYLFNGLNLKNLGEKRRVEIREIKKL